jgi:thiamine pyrophosphate-dependent acetolactate synthase large subunit-like protein
LFILAIPFIHQQIGYSVAAAHDDSEERLLPAAVLTLDEQTQRSYGQYLAQPNGLARNTFLTALHDRNEYAAIAQAAGLHSVHIEQPAEVRSALAEAMAHPGPVLIDLVTDPNVLSIPRTSPRPR